MVGLNGVVIKSHGSAGAYSFGNAIRVAVIEARKGVPTQIIELLKAQTPAPLESPSAPINTPIAAQES
jgi:glycerol-3-phosphate acyltransferase PlsX